MSTDPLLPCLVRQVTNHNLVGTLHKESAALLVALVTQWSAELLARMPPPRRPGGSAPASAASSAPRQSHQQQQQSQQLQQQPRQQGLMDGVLEDAFRPARGGASRRGSGSSGGSGGGGQTAPAAAGSGRVPSSAFVPTAAGAGGAFQPRAMGSSVIVGGGWYPEAQHRGGGAGNGLAPMDIDEEGGEQRDMMGAAAAAAAHAPADLGASFLVEVDAAADASPLPASAADASAAMLWRRARPASQGGAAGVNGAGAAAAAAEAASPVLLEQYIQRPADPAASTLLNGANMDAGGWYTVPHASIGVGGDSQYRGVTQRTLDAGGRQGSGGRRSMECPQGQWFPNAAAAAPQPPADGSASHPVPQHAHAPPIMPPAPTQAAAPGVHRNGSLPVPLDEDYLRAPVPSDDWDGDGGSSLGGASSGGSGAWGGSWLDGWLGGGGGSSYSGGSGGGTAWDGSGLPPPADPSAACPITRVALRGFSSMWVLHERAPGTRAGGEGRVEVEVDSVSGSGLRRGGERGLLKLVVAAHGMSAAWLEKP